MVAAWHQLRFSMTGMVWEGNCLQDYSTKDVLYPLNIKHTFPVDLKAGSDK